MFKQCPCCQHPWQSRRAFLSDPATRLVGYQVNFEDLQLGFFLFDHDTCGTSLALPAGDFQDMYDGEIFQQRKTGTPDCPEYCLQRDTLSACPAACECAFVREVLQMILAWPKRSPGGVMPPATDG